MITHKGAVNTIIDINSRCCISEKDAVLALSSLHFDLSVYDIFGILGSGGKVVIPEYSQIKDPEKWLKTNGGRGDFLYGIQFRHLWKC